MKPKFKTQLVQLSKKDIAEQKRFLIQYENLLQKEYNYKDLKNENNISIYKRQIETIENLIANPFIEMPIFE